MTREISEVKYSQNFLKHLFRANPFDPILRTHKLHGKEKEAWAFWIDYTYRIKFIFLNDDVALFLDIGTHEIYT